MTVVVRVSSEKSPDSRRRLKAKLVRKKSELVRSEDQKGEERVLCRFGADLDEASVKCPVCWDYLAGAIFACPEGHTVCGGCYDRLSKPPRCPVCRMHMARSRVRVLEDVFAKVNMPCRWPGCEFVGIKAARTAHEAHCSWAPCSCPFAADCFRGDAAAVLEHAGSHHDAVLLRPEVRHRRNLVSPRAMPSWTLPFRSHSDVYALFAVKRDSFVYLSVQRVFPLASPPPPVKVVVSVRLHSGQRLSLTLAPEDAPCPASLSYLRRKFSRTLRCDRALCFPANLLEPATKRIHLPLSIKLKPQLEQHHPHHHHHHHHAGSRGPFDDDDDDYGDDRAGMIDDTIARINDPRLGSLAVTVLKTARAEVQTTRELSVSLPEARDSIIRGEFYSANGYANVQHPRLPRVKRGDQFVVEYVHPRGGPTIEKHTISVDNDESFVVDVIARSPTVPFGTNFMTFVTLTLSQHGKRVDMSTKCRVVWCQPARLGFIRGRIESAAERGATEAYDRLAQALAPSPRHRRPYLTPVRLLLAFVHSLFLRVRRVFGRVLSILFYLSSYN
ncbi:hypothetical protein CTAYLR_000399 [Chrysophaeum taylorii]|uniref:RING-type domain-containing protein n=1 Tax=Chrysophaeum taylorii TaxID=2483200 RepID=A0AAD7UGN0_9STRA|nr:hypothetical protein CTAYLR_000399 [Chrysophaeum taylorii]